MKRWIPVISMSICVASLIFSQNVLVNGSFDDGLEGWTHFSRLDGGFEGIAEAVDDGFGPAHGNGPYLWMACTGDGYFNQCVWQPVTVQPGDTFEVNGAFKDLTGGELQNWWCELYIGETEPLETVDYTTGLLTGFKTWDNCAAGIDGTFQEDACVPPNRTTWIAPGVPGSGEITVYFMIKTGIWQDGSLGEIFYEIGIDELSMIRTGGASAVGERITAVAGFGLHPNYPNPFNPETTLRFSLDGTSETELSVYDIHGRPIRTLLRTTLDAGTYSFAWDGLDGRGHAMSSGVYLCRLRAGNRSETRRLVLMK